MGKNKTNRKIETGDSLSIFKAAELHAKIMEVYNISDAIEIDLSSVTDCDAAGIQILYSLKKSSLRDGKKIVFKNISGAVENVLNKMCISSDTIL